MRVDAAITCLESVLFHITGLLWMYWYKLHHTPENRDMALFRLEEDIISIRSGCPVKSASRLIDYMLLTRCLRMYLSMYAVVKAIMG